MDFTERGLVRIEANDKEGEVLGHALALGQSFAEGLQERGYEIPDSVEKMTQFVVALVLAPVPDMRKEVLAKFKDAKIDTTPRDIAEEDLASLVSGLLLMQSFSELQFRDRLANANLGGRNGRSAFLDYGPMAARYHERIVRAISENKLKALGLD